jgi:hypothetical protein
VLVCLRVANVMTVTAILEDLLPYIAHALHHSTAAESSAIDV